MQSTDHVKFHSVIEKQLFRYISFGSDWFFDESLPYSLEHIANEEFKEYQDLAFKIARKGKGDVITFSPKIFIPLTTLCRDFCGYCTFRKSPDQAPDLYMGENDVMALIAKGTALNCKEALFTLGERPELRYEQAETWLKNRGYKTTLEYLTAICNQVFNNTEMFPHVNPGTMSGRELNALSNSNVSMGMMLESTSSVLYGPGMPHEFAPSKRPGVRIKTMRNAGLQNIPFTTGILIGLGESKADVVDSLLAIKRLYQEYGHIQEVIIQNFKSKPETQMSNHPDAEPDYLSWSIVVARLILGPDMNIQVPPNLSFQNFSRYLQDGINDWGGISPLTIDHVNPEAPWPSIKNLQKACENHGLKLKPRFPIYPEFFLNTDLYVNGPKKEKLISQADESGYIKGGIELYCGQPKN